MPDPTMEGDRCGEDNCPSTRWKPTETDGEEICENGHRRISARVIAEQDDDDFAGPVSGKRTKRKKDEVEKVAKHEVGRKGFELYLLCFQLILRKQIWWLVREKGFPKEFESIVQDLWAIRLDQLSDRMDLDALSESETDSQTFSSQSDDGSSSEGGESMNSRLVKVSSSPKLPQSIALCYVASHLLRLPIFIGDFLKWIRGGKLLYYRALKETPKEMLDRLPGQYHPLLEAHSVLDSRTLYHAVTATFLLYQKDIEIVFPPLNYPLHLFRCMEELVLPIEVYPAFKRLATLVPYTFRIPQESRGVKLRITDFPEGQFVACLVIAVKLLYPFDSIKRFPTRADDPGAAVIDWSIWNQATKVYKSGMKPRGRLDWEAAMNTTEDEVLDMSNSKIDDYLDYYTQSWTIEDTGENDRDRDFRQTMLDMFPVPTTTRSPPAATDDTALKKERSQTVQASMVYRRPIAEESDNDEGVARPGSFYTRYRKETDLRGHAKAFYKAVAELSGLSLKCIVRVVFLTETKLQLHDEEEEEVSEELATASTGMGKGKERAL
ncbi:hypothetical protein EJ08DRAFT_697620 [Tothia fuscella]|uniref:RRN7-type domain-containing protein n=1 Tax=Tothia fuscella TaxID=1048955 RepID=A0A9P4NQ89_9PEZI|nr:hypothetical protein EJ08DRAFT_697620 [Tothia fuscella]